MKRKICCLFFVFLFAALPMAQASTVKYAPIGNAGEILSAAAVYCNKWDELIGSTFGYDMAFNDNNMSVVQEKHYDIGGNQVTTFNIDGIHVDADADLTVYSIQIPVLSGKKEQYTSTARIFAVLNALAYDYPYSDEEMSQRYMACLGEYVTFMEENKDILAAGNSAYWTVKTEKGEFKFSFISVNGRLMMIYNKIYFED